MGTLQVEVISVSADKNVNMSDFLVNIEILVYVYVCRIKYIVRSRMCDVTSAMSPLICSKEFHNKISWNVFTASTQLSIPPPQTTIRMIGQLKTLALIL